MKIAFMGISGSGKDYFADFLIKEYSFIRFSFSDQLKKLSKKIFPWLEQDYPAIEKEVQLDITLSTGEQILKSPREIWLELNCLRKIESKIFIRMLEDEIHQVTKTLSRNIEDNFTSIIISDIRTLDEYQWCKKNNFIVIYINPLKQIYPKNNFDKNIFNAKMIPDYTFDNNYNGINSFKNFFNNKVVKK